jgi:hypothetical protein
MINSKINQKSPEKEFILVKNVSAATLSAGAAAYYDTASATDGFAVSGARTGQKFLFAGIAAEAISSSSKGLVQTYGICSAYVQWSGALAAGQQLDAVTSQTYLTAFVAVSATSLVPTVDNPWNFATAMSAAASGISTATLEVIFVRAR